MKLRFGPWTVRVRIARERLYRDGAEKAALWVWREGVAYISPSVAPRRRLAALLHEGWHAWVDTFGRPSDEESQCDSVAAFAADLMEQVRRQGGELALARLDSDGVVDWDADVQDFAGLDMASVGAQCGGCGQTFGVHQVVSGVPMPDAATGQAVVMREVYCDHCGVLQRWREVANPSGAATGQVVGTLGRVSDRAAIAGFLREHGQRFGLVCAE